VGCGNPRDAIDADFRRVLKVSRQEVEIGLAGIARWNGDEAVAQQARSGAAAKLEKSGVQRLKRWAPLALLLVLTGAAFMLGLHRHLTFENLVQRRDALHLWTDHHKLSALLIYIALYWAVVALSLPGAGFITIAGGLLFGVWIGAPATIVAATLGATTLFLVARSSLGAALAERAGPWLTRLSAGFEREGLSYMLFLRLVPFPFFIVNLVPAVIGVPLRTFVVGTFLGIIPATFAFSYLGETLDRIIVHAQAAYDACVAEKGAGACQLMVKIESLPIKHILIALTLLGLLALIPPLAKRWRARHATA
jgi:uncharacterized membrane protein YdjX (TVP38/TMEM64 family)